MVILSSYIPIQITLACQTYRLHAFLGCVVVQSWAQLEEEQGLYQRANELRNFSLQEQTSVVPPLNLGTHPDDPLLTSVFKQVSRSLCCVQDLQLTQAGSILQAKCMQYFSHAFHLPVSRLCWMCAEASYLLWYKDGLSSTSASCWCLGGCIAVLLYVMMLMCLSLVPIVPSCVRKVLQSC